MLWDPRLIVFSKLASSDYYKIDTCMTTHVHTHAHVVKGATCSGTDQKTTKRKEASCKETSHKETNFEEVN